MIELSRRGGIAVIRMNHGKANALDIELCDGLAAQFEACRGSDTHAVVLTGQGPMFSAGVDLLRLSDGGAPYVRSFLPALHRLYHTVFFFPKPVVAAVNGHAIAGGCVLQACADKRIAVSGAGRIGVTELLVGVPFPPLAFEIMRFATPPAFFAETVLSGATYGPEIAQARRMVDELADGPAALFDRAIAAA
jgi:enoyl-CoA hydratase